MAEIMSGFWPARISVGDAKWASVETIAALSSQFPLPSDRLSTACYVNADREL
jgi:hypothetical protein